MTTKGHGEGVRQLREWGVKGVKVDFWHSDKQDRIQQYRDVLRDAAEFHLLVDFHGSTIPRGWSREFPNLVSMEAVFGAEQYKFARGLRGKAPRHNTILPFTRNVVGPMDYTPVTFSDSKFPHTTTDAHELALSVIFESGVQHFADSVESYRSLPDAPKQFLKDVPAAWDDTRAIAGTPGRAVLVARRAGAVWYVAGISGQDAADVMKLPLDFLGAGAWQLTLIRDGADDRTFDASTRPRRPVTRSRFRSARTAALSAAWSRAPPPDRRRDDTDFRTATKPWIDVISSRRPEPEVCSRWSPT